MSSWLAPFGRLLATFGVAVALPSPSPSNSAQSAVTINNGNGLIASSLVLVPMAATNYWLVGADTDVVVICGGKNCWLIGVNMVGGTVACCSYSCDSGHSM